MLEPGELSAAMCLFTIGATVLGNVVSYRRRADPWPAVKPILAACAVGGFVWFIATVTRDATPGDISTVEGPLAVLFVWVLSTHAFDVPAKKGRRVLVGWLGCPGRGGGRTVGRPLPRRLCDRLGGVWPLRSRRHVAVDRGGEGDPVARDRGLGGRGPPSRRGPSSRFPAPECPPP